MAKENKVEAVKKKKEKSVATKCTESYQRCTGGQFSKINNGQ